MLLSCSSEYLNIPAVEPFPDNPNHTDSAADGRTVGSGSAASCGVVMRADVVHVLFQEDVKEVTDKRCIAHTFTFDMILSSSPHNLLSCPSVMTGGFQSYLTDQQQQQQ